jgi:hypothetical protein
MKFASDEAERTSDWRLRETGRDAMLVHLAVGRSAPPPLTGPRAARLARRMAGSVERGPGVAADPETPLQEETQAGRRVSDFRAGSGGTRRV